MKRDEWQFLQDLFLAQPPRDGFLESQLGWKTPWELISAKDFPIPSKRAFAILQKWSDQGLLECGVSLRTGWLTSKGRNLAIKCLVAQECETIRDCNLKLVRLCHLSDLHRPRPEIRTQEFYKYSGSYASGPSIGILEDQGDNGLHLYTTEKIFKGWNGGEFIRRENIGWIETVDNPTMFAKIEKAYENKFGTAGRFSYDPSKV